MIKPSTRLLYFISIYFVIYFLLVLFNSDNSFIGLLFGNILSLLGILFTIGCLIIVHNNCNKNERRYWLFLLLGTISYLIGDILWFYSDTVLQILDSPGWPDLFYLLQELLFINALLQLIYKNKSINSGFSFTIDILITMIAAFSLGWQYLLRPAFSASNGDLLYLLVSVSYIIFNLGILFGFISLYLNKNTSFKLVSGKYFSIGLGIFLIADVTYLYFSTDGTYDNVRWINPIWVYGLMLIGISGFNTLFAKDPDEINYKNKENKLLINLRTVIPYLSISLLLIFIVIELGSKNFIVYGLIITGILIMIRQVFVIRQNRKLIISLQNANSEMKYTMHHSQLTGLYNRTFFEQEMKKLQTSELYPISIMTFDVDGLKLINDTLGHDQGDKLLKACANILTCSMRETDIIARISGDEFSALLPLTDNDTAQMLLNLIYQNVEEYNFNNKSLPLSISIGLATSNDLKIPLEKVLKDADDRMYTEKLVHKKSIRSQVIDSLMAALAERDFDTEGHAQRLIDYCTKIGNRLNLSMDIINDLSLLAQAHDLGKVGIPDSILFKDGPLTENEWKIMRKHSEKGYRIALASTDLKKIADLIYKHHEKWDGTGYPLGIKGIDIPLECRILSIIDAYDAMISNRPYKKAKSIKDAIIELERNSGTQFDPELTELFISILNEEINENTTAS